MQLLWVKAPLLLRRHPPLLLAVVVCSALAALAGASVSLVRAGVQSESLNAQIGSMSPLAAGFEARVIGSPTRGDEARRAAAVKLGHTLPFLGPVVASSLVPALVAGTDEPGLEVVALARTGAVAHVGRITRNAGRGVWIADSTAKVTGLRPGEKLRLTVQGFLGRTHRVTLPIAGIYRALEGDRDNPYWANWIQDIRSTSANVPPPPAFVLMSEANLERVAGALSPFIENRFEYPVDTRRLSFADARDLAARFGQLGIRLPDSPAGSELNCHPGNCLTSSSLEAALVVAASDVAAISPTIELLSAIGLAVAFGLSVAAGIFLVRRRADEANVLFTRGEAPAAFAARTALETLLPAAAGLAAGVGLATFALRLLAPQGTVTRDTISTAAVRALAAVGVTVVLIAVGAASAFPRRRRASSAPTRRIMRIPWETLPLVLAAVPLALVLAGKGLVHDATGASHPRLAVFLVPMPVIAAVAGLSVRGTRALLTGRGAASRPAVFLALRRLAAARGVLVAVVVAAAIGIGAFAYSSILSSSVERSAAEKEYVSNGSDVQGFVDTSVRIMPPFPFPATIVEVDDRNVSLDGGGRADLVAGDPNALAHVLLWGSGWPNDPRRLLSRLTAGGELTAIATPDAPTIHEIFDQGVRIPVRVVGHAAIPGSSAGRPALLVSRVALRRIARRTGILEPAPLANGLIWAKGPPNVVIPAIVRSNLGAAYLTTLAHIHTASVTAAERSYRYVRAIGLAAAVLSLVALLLYLQARQRSQLIASALTRRMGFGLRGDALSLALEAGAVVLVAGIAGAAAAVATAGVVVPHVDSLPLYAPSPELTIPWTTITLALAAAVAAGAMLGMAAALIAARSDAAEALRVA